MSKYKRKHEKVKEVAYIPCFDTRPCFARSSKDAVNGRPFSCSALVVPYEKNGQCPFCKEHSYITHGKSYAIPVKRKRGLDFTW